MAAGECREAVYALTYGPNSSLWVTITCCDNNCRRPARQETFYEAEPNAVRCHYCSGDKLAPCDSLSVVNCTGNQTVCVTLIGTWHGGHPQMLKGCATPEICHLPKNTTLGPKESGFQLSAGPECTQPGTHAPIAHTEGKRTTCFTCWDPHHCSPLPCPEGRNYCLQTSGILALGDGSSVTWRNGSCMASKDCKFNNSISALTFSIDFGFWVNTSCCQGNCQEPAPPVPLPTSHTLSNFLCPSCIGDLPEPCNASFYQQCPNGETECVQLNLEPEAGGRNLSVRGCGSRDLCRTLAVTEGLLVFPGYRLAGPPDCSSGQRAIMDSKCHSGAAAGLRVALPVLAVALGTAALS
ncbi:uncharacterized protein LOC143659063 isoform X2 [Tamandua tetradactyla]|uniref:uncharacterized protein LOC143659063 isoform X2 n=1 Tax=Tamandua tetradactyla TaxID=48850 RepID=UPI0040544DB0